MNNVVTFVFCMFILIVLSQDLESEVNNENPTAGKDCRHKIQRTRRNYNIYAETVVPELNVDYRGIEYSGVLSPNCVRQYQRIFVTRRVPPRNYQYFHETLDPELQGRGDEQEYYNSLFRWRIVGGKAVSIEDIPYQVLYGKFCGGSLIAPEWVITAAHCKEKEKYVYAGSTNRDDATPYRICAHFTHPLWNKTKNHSHDYDYQLILLENPIPVTPFSRPIAIGSVDDVQPGKNIGVSGWGHLEYRKSKMQNQLRRVFVPIMQDAICKTMPGGNYDKITPRMFCAGLINGTKDSCQGDSGGPAVINNKLVGLVSFGVGCASPNHPGVYTNIPMGREWIRAVTALPL